MERLSSDIESFIRTGRGAFESLALLLFEYQFEKNEAYKAYIRSQNIQSAQIKRWQDIPAVPIQAFKSAQLTTFPPAQAAAMFESSGTTIKTPSRHYLKTLSFYEASLKGSFERCVIPDKASLAFLILTPPPSEAPRSSLTWMMDVVKRKYGTTGSQYFIRNGRLDELWLATMLKKSQMTNAPVALLGTTLAFLAFFEFCMRSGHRFSLPKGSRLMDTGGMKGQKREVTRPDFIRQVGAILGISEAQCINEYGMCEMSSQFYGTGNSKVLQGPAWVRTLIVDPSSGKEVPDGETGNLRHFDLANVDSVMAIQTEDLGRSEGDGFELLGRAPESDLKGCSLTAEAFLR